MRIAAAIIATTLAAGAAQAATVAYGTTQADGSGGINPVGGTSMASFLPGFFSAETTTPASEWVWVDLPGVANDLQDVDAAVFEFTFDLTGYDLSTVELAGRWGVDNYGEIFLNGTSIGGLLSQLDMSNFTTLHDYGTVDDGLFLSGVNVLQFSVNDAGGQAGFRATAVVTADLAAVPLPAGAALLGLGLGALAFGRRKA